VIKYSVKEPFAVKQNKFKLVFHPHGSMDFTATKY